MSDLTRVVQRSQVSEQGCNGLGVPVHRASTIVFDTAREYAERKHRGPDGYSYGLHGTPTTKMLEAQLSALEEAAGTVILPSGQAAIALLFPIVLEPGDTVLIPDNLYPPVRELCTTLLAGVRLAHVGKVSTGFAQRLGRHPAVAYVLHPSLADCPGHLSWQRDFQGASGMFSIVPVDGLDPRIDAALEQMTVFAIGASWGGTRSLIAPMIVQRDLPDSARGGDRRLLRVSIGLEDPEDLWTDLVRLLDHMVESGAVHG